MGRLWYAFRTRIAPVPRNNDSHSEKPFRKLSFEARFRGGKEKMSAPVHHVYEKSHEFGPHAWLFLKNVRIENRRKRSP